MKRPNIILIQSDSMDGRAMSCCRHPAVRTPNFDRLAERGVLFSQTYCNSPQCVPSRASMWSGRHVHEVGAWNNYQGLSPETPTFATHLAEAGYDTIVLGRTDHLSGGHTLLARLSAWTRSVPGGPLFIKPRPEPRTLDTRGIRTRRTDWKTLEEAERHLAQANPEIPFFLHVGFAHPHPGGGFNATPELLKSVDRSRIAPPSFTMPTHPAMRYMTEAKACDGEFTEAEVREIRRHYFAMVAEVDAMVGRLLDAVDEAGLADRTWIIYCSDHGEMNMEHRQWLKNAMYEGSARVPLIVAGPDARKGVAADQLVSLIDLFPTLMDMAGAPHPTRLSGRSLMPLLVGREDSRRPDWVLSQYHSNMQPTGSFMIRRGPWKYVAFAGMAPMLFNLSEDPNETNDLAGVWPDLAASMEQKLRQQIDYMDVDRQAKAQDRELFMRWRAQLSEQQYREALGPEGAGAAPDAYERIEAWLAG